jgi:hypothetical protein
MEPADVKIIIDGHSGYNNPKKPVDLITGSEKGCAYQHDNVIGKNKQ